MTPLRQAVADYLAIRRGSDSSFGAQVRCCQTSSPIWSAATLPR